MRYLITLLALFICTAKSSAIKGHADELSTRMGHIWFQSKTSMQEIESHNYQASSLLDISKGDLAISVLIRSFEFEKALMEQHFNENYLESDKYPNALFKGRIIDISKVNFAKPGVYPVTVEGDLTIHGTTNSIKNNGTITVGPQFVIARAQIPVRLKDYNIIIPQLVQEKIAEVVQVNVDIKYNL